MLRKDVAEKAAKAHSDLNVFATIITILEGGHLYGSTSTVNAAANKIIAICKTEAQRCLREYDARLDEVGATDAP